VRCGIAVGHYAGETLGFYARINGSSGDGVRGLRASSIVALLVLMPAACGDDEPGSRNAGGSPQPLNRVREVLDRNRDALMKRYDAYSVGIGVTVTGRSPAPTERVHRIVVGVDDRAMVPDGPRDVQGVPIEFRVSDQPTFD